MIKSENYPNAYKEVYVILNNMKEEDVKAIPQSFVDMIKENMNNEYKFELDRNKDFEEQSLLKETKVILAYIFINYWGTSEQKSKVMQKFRQDIIKEEQQKQGYKPEELFKSRKKQEAKVNCEKSEITEIAKYNEGNIWSKLINKIKGLFKRK